MALEGHKGMQTQEAYFHPATSKGIPSVSADHLVWSWDRLLDWLGD